MTSPAVDAGAGTDDDSVEPVTDPVTDPADSTDPDGPADPADPGDAGDAAPPDAGDDGPSPVEPAGPPPVEPNGPSRIDLRHPIGLVMAALIGGALAVGFDASSRLAVTAVGVVQGLLIVSWVLSSGLIGRTGALVIAAAAAVAADIAVTHRHGQLGELVAVLGLAMIALFGHQLLRARRRVNVVESLAGIALLVVAVVALAAPIELRYQVSGTTLTVAVLLCVAVAVVAGHLIDWIWVPLRFDPAVRRGFLALVGSVVAGAVVAVARLRHTVEFTTGRAVLLGGALALVTALFAVAAAFIAAGAPSPDGRAARVARPLAMTTFTFALASPFAYLLCVALRG